MKRARVSLVNEKSEMNFGMATSYPTRAAVQPLRVRVLSWSTGDVAPARCCFGGAGAPAPVPESRLHGTRPRDTCLGQRSAKSSLYFRSYSLALHDRRPTGGGPTAGVT